MRELLPVIFKTFGIIALIAVLGFALRAVLMPANLAVERMAITHSYQYKAGMESRAATLRANIAEIDAMLDGGVGNTKVLQAQRRGLNAQLTATYR